MSREIAKLFRSSGLITMGRFGAMLTRFLAVIIVVRMISPADYGVLSLAYVLVYMGAMTFSFGTNSATPRYMAMRKSTELSIHGMQEIVTISFIFNLCMALTASVITYQLAIPLSVLFNMPGLDAALRLFAWMLFPLIMILNMTAIFRGLEMPRAKVFFEDIGINGLRLLAVLVCFLLGLGYLEVMLAYVLAVWAVFVAYAFYAQAVIRQYIVSDIELRKVGGFLLFSIPLFGVDFANHASGMMGSFVLGYFGTAEQVAYYNAPYRLSQMLLVPITAIGFMFVPIATKLFVERKQGELKVLFAAATKWSGLLVLPVCLYLFIDVEHAVAWIFGEKYLPSTDVLRVFVIGYCLHTMAGPNGLMLVVAGAGKSLLLSVVLGLLASLLMAILLVSNFGAVGVAVATVVGLMTTNVISSLMMYWRTGVPPMSLDSFAAFSLSLLIQLLFYIVFLLVGVDYEFSLLILLLVMIPLSLSVPFLTGTMTMSDIQLLSKLESKVMGCDKWAQLLLNSNRLRSKRL